MISLENVSKKYETSGKDSNFVLENLSLQFKDGEFTCILGKSGCGKSTLLNLIAGYIKADSGCIYSNGSILSGPSKDIGVVFQEHALFPWDTVYENIAFGPSINKAPDKNETVMKYLDLIGLTDYKDYYPSQLSGGMKQRVGIARAFANHPKTLLMDEPFSALDPITRQSMRTELLKIWKESNCTVIFITHDVSEAVYLADKVVILGDGNVKMTDTVHLERERDIHSPEFISYEKKYEEQILS